MLDICKSSNRKLNALCVLSDHIVAIAWNLFLKQTESDNLSVFCHLLLFDHFSHNLGGLNFRRYQSDERSMLQTNSCKHIELDCHDYILHVLLDTVRYNCGAFALVLLHGV